MNIIEPYARMMAPACSSSQAFDLFRPEDGIKLLRHVEWCARISHRSEEAQTHDSWRRLLTAVVIQHGDWSVTEHASVSVDFLVDRGITHEIVRHRLFAFTQESTRFCNYGKKNGEIKVIRPEFTEENGPYGDRDWIAGVKGCEDTYLTMLANKVPPQIARSVLPNSLASRLIVTGNLRNWRHFLIMRTTAEAHPQMRQVTIPLLAEFKAKIPLLYDDIEPLAKQSEGMRRAR